MTPYYADDWLTVYSGDCREAMAAMPPSSVHCVVTSPPYWGLRDYGTTGQLGLEPTPEAYVENMVAVFREVRRVLRDDGTVWLNLGDSYNGVGRGEKANGLQVAARATSQRTVRGLKEKDLVGIPWRVAFALQQPYYTGQIKDERDRIWLAAMLDAEGCLFLHKRKVGQSNGQGYYRKADSYGAGMEIANTNLAIVERCMAIAGGRGSITRQEKDRRQPLYRWSMRSNECRDVVRELYPHLVAKQHQARLLIGCPSSGPEAEKAHAGLMELHGGGVPDIDFPAPASMFEPGWYVRSDVIWSKLNPMPESVTDRPTKAHEYLFLLSKSPRYYFDADAVREPHAPTQYSDAVNRPMHMATTRDTDRGEARRFQTETLQYNPAGRNLRSVWTIATQPYPGAHFATFPEKLVEPCVKAGTSEKGVCSECGAPWTRTTQRPDIESPWNDGAAPRNDGRPDGAERRKPPGGGPGWETYQRLTTGWRATCRHFPADEVDYTDPRIGNAQTVPATVLDPFAGSGTTGRVAQRLGRRAVLIDLSAEYLLQAMARNSDIPLGLETA